MSKKTLKTNALRLLDAANITYQIHTYTIDDDLIDGASVHQKLGLPPTSFFKTLVARGKTNNFYVFVIPVLEELNLKKAAKAVGEKSIEMIAVKELLTVTGYIRGGCSPVGMKKPYPTIFDSSMENLSEIYVSAGKKGILMQVHPQDLLQITTGTTADISI